MTSVHEMENGFSMVFQWQTSISDSEGSLISGTLTSALDVLFGNYTCITVVQGMMCECSYNDRFGHRNAPFLNLCFGSINFCNSRIYSALKSACYLALNAFIV